MSGRPDQAGGGPRRSPPAGDEPPLREPPPRSIRESVRDVLRSRDLLVAMVRRDLKTKHAGSALGFFWSLLTPALTVAVYATVFALFRFSPVSKGGFEDMPFALFFFAGLVLWNVMSAGLDGGTGSVVGQGFLVRKIWFPRELLPMSVVLSAVVTFVFEFAVLLLFSTVLGHPPSWTVALALPLMAIVTLLAFGAALFLSAANVYFRDLQHLVRVMLQLAFWAAPILYDFSFVSEQHPDAARLLLLNPLTPLLIAFREVVLIGDLPSDPERLAYSAAVAVAAVVLGWVYFNRHERRMAELV